MEVGEKGPMSPPQDDGLLRALVLVAVGVGLLGLVLLCILVPSLTVVLVLAIAACVAAGFLFGRWRSSRQETLLWALAIAAERGVPLATVFEAIATQREGRSRQRLLVLSGMSNAGVPLPEALMLVPGMVPRDAQALIRVGWDCGVLAPALREAAAARVSRQPVWSALASRLSYLVFVLIAVQAITSFVMYFILPKYQAIFRDFGIPLPGITRFVIDASHVLLGSLGPLVALVVLGEVVVLVLLPGILAGWWNLDVPLVDRLLRRKHSAQVLRALARVVEAERPLPWGLTTLSRYYPSSWIRGRLGWVLQDVGEGADVWEALRVRALIRPADAAVLEAARRTGNLAWALRETAEGGERRLGYRLQAGLQLLTAVVVLGLGVLVFVLAAAYFLPIVTVMERLSG